MPRKPAIAKETEASAKPARVTKSSTPRVKAAQHSKVVPAEPVTAAPLVAAPVEKIEQPVLSTPGNSREAIAKIAYGYWESRGFQGGNEIEDWVRAEHEYRQSTGVTEPRASASVLAR
jgi:hypothetical protein